jgi:hypothetical protein
MSKKHQFKDAKDEHGAELDPFHEMIVVMETEHLIRFRRRLEKVGRKKMVEILTTEIAERDGAEQERAKAEQVQVKEEKKQQQQQQQPKK